jgi:hypothetical protein
VTWRERRPLRGKDKVALRLGKVINHYKVGKHCTISITDDVFIFARDRPRSSPRRHWTASTSSAPAVDGLIDRLDDEVSADMSRPTLT